MNDNDKLQLKATNEKECDIISTLLQDSIFCLESHNFDINQKCFSLMFNRFCWENIFENTSIDEKNKIFFRVHSGIYIYNVESIQYTDNIAFFNNQHNCDFLNLLSIHANNNEISLLFSDNKRIFLKVESILVYMKDLHEKYATNVKPEHQFEQTVF